MEATLTPTHSTSIERPRQLGHLGPFIVAVAAILATLATGRPGGLVSTGHPAAGLFSLF